VEDSLERFISDTIDYLDTEGRLDPFYPEPREDVRGRPSFHPVLMMKVLVFGYSIDIRNFRKLDRLFERAIAFRYLATNQQPDFRTITDFRNDHCAELSHLFEEILGLGQDTELANLGEVALYGRRVQGDAALDANRTRDGLEKEI
jgi:transposase